jgi:hypothetical protein
MLREEHRLRVFENRVLRRIFGPKRDEVTGEWRKLHSEELHNLYSSPGKVCLRTEDAFVIISVANLMEVKVLYVQKDLRYEISSYWCFNV